MCGIYGFAFRQGGAKTQETSALLASLITLSESRGKEAAGIAIRNNQEIKVYKEANRGSAFMGTKTFQTLTKDMLSTESLGHSPTALIGHTRLVTNGSMERNDNNQPVVRGGMVCIHNGIIVNDGKLFAEHALQRTCEVDTEVLLALVEQKRKNGSDIATATGEAFGEIRGTASVALFAQDQNALLLGTNNGSLYVLGGAGGMVFASERFMLEEIVKMHGETFGFANDGISHVEPGTGVMVNLTSIERTVFRFGETTPLLSTAAIPLTVLPSEHESQAPAIINPLTPDIVAKYQAIFDANAAKVAQMKRCVRCILPQTMPFVDFDAEGVCVFCRNHVKQEFLGEEALRKEVEKYRGNGKDPDCLFPLSGGRDSSYGLHYVKKVLKLNPVAYSYDWGMLTDLGRRNQARMCGELQTEHLLISADITKKRRYIRQNVLAWLKNPELGTVPLFMAGDKQYFYYLNKLRKQVRAHLSIYCENPLEQTNFKFGFLGIPPKFNRDHVYRIGIWKKLKMALYYAKQYVRNPRLLNTSIIDTIGAFLATYFIPHDYIYLFNYIPWDEDTINRTLIDMYDWELAPDTTTTWRIGDGTAAFYNYIYFTIAGFTENDTFRSNQIREGLMTREKGLELATVENRPRFESLKWYGDTIGIDIWSALDIINATPKRY